MDTTSLRVALGRLRRKLTFWRVLALLAIGALVTVLLEWQTDVVVEKDHIARVRVDRFILGDQRKLDLLDQLAKKKNVRAVIVRINSPGGTTWGAQAIYDALRRVAGKKPVVTVMDSVAASGGYLVALAGERMFAGGNTITGSIGVIVEWPELHELLGKVGIRMQAVRSGPLKAVPNSLEPTPPEARRVIEEMVRDSYDWFVSLVAKHRNLAMSTARKLADGRIYTGRQALRAGLVDELGDEIAARKWLEKKHGISLSTAVKEYHPHRPLLERLELVNMLASLLARLGLYGHRAGLTLPSARVDGLLSVWHPALVSAGAGQ